MPRNLGTKHRVRVLERTPVTLRCNRVVSTRIACEPANVGRGRSLLTRSWPILRLKASEETAIVLMESSFQPDEVQGPIRLMITVRMRNLVVCAIARVLALLPCRDPFTADLYRFWLPSDATESHI